MEEKVGWRQAEFHLIFDRKGRPTILPSGNQVDGLPLVAHLLASVISSHAV